MRASNTAMLLRLLWSAPSGAARTDLAKRSGLSRATVSAIVHELFDTDLVAEGAQRASRGGRPARVLRFQGRSRAIIGVELGASHVSAIRMDLLGDVQARLRQEHPVQRDPAGALDLLGDFIRQLEGGADAPLLGIGVGVPSPLRLDQPGRLSQHLLPRWRDVDLVTWLRARTAGLIRIDNDANAGALAEHWWGAGRSSDDFVYLKVATGVGAGIISGGQIMRGANGSAGEIGHTAIDPDGPLCRCGLQGCLEAFVGTQYLLERAEEVADTLDPRPTWADPAPTLPALIRAANQGDAVATELIRATGHWLGIAISNLLNLVNPGRIVLGGRLTAAGPLLLDPLRAALSGRSLWTSFAGAQVVVSGLTADAVARGAATLVLQEALSDPALLFAQPGVHPRP